MEQAPCNPAANKLGEGLSENQIETAVGKSGYPLQTIVGDILRSRKIHRGSTFGVQEEWCYVDRGGAQLRTIDLVAGLRLHDWDPQPRVRPNLVLLIECKQSQLPYVFFEASEAPWLIDFPIVAGLKSEKVVITSDDAPSTWHYTVTHVLDIVRDEFQRSPQFCHTLSKCVRKGAEIELSGTDAHSSLLLPLNKAVQHFVRAEAPPETAWYFDCNLVLALAVLDAPMVSVRAGSGGPKLTAVPWVRVLRHEYEEEADRFDRQRLRVIDVIHRDFLEPYLDKHLLPFASRFSERVLRHTTELATGLAFVPRMGADGRGPIEYRLQPRPPWSALSRARLIGGRIVRFLTGSASER